MKNLLALLSVIIIGLSLQSCAQFGTSAKTLWTNPAIQAEIAAAEQMAIQFYHTWITSHLGASRSLRSSGARSSMSSARQAIKAKYPDMPDRIINSIVVSTYAGG